MEIRGNGEHYEKDLQQSRHHYKKAFRHKAGFRNSASPFLFQDTVIKVIKLMKCSYLTKVPFDTPRNVKGNIRECDLYKM